MANWSPDLDLSERPLYLALANAIAAAVERQELLPGARLPTHRALAQRLGISIHTVSSAYAEAERRGLLLAETGRGTFVQMRAGDTEARFIMDRRLDDLVDLSTNRPVAGPIHAERIRATLAALAADADHQFLLACRPIAGLDAHRAAGAEWVARRGVRVPPDQVLVCNGAAHGLAVAFATLARPGDVVATEAVVDHGVIALAGTLNLRLRGLAVDAQGIVPDAFEEACRGEPVAVLCATPCLNNPTVAMMGETRRRQIAEIARRHGVAIVEDDVYGALVPDAPPALSAFAPERGYYVTSHTKTLVSGLRTGYLAAPAKAVPRLATRLRATSWMATPLVSEIATRWIADGTAEHLLQWQRERLSARHQLVARYLAGHEYASHPNGLHVWLTLPAPWRATAFVQEARLENVAVTPSEPFVVGRQPEPHSIRLSIGGPRSEAQLERGLATLAELLGRNPEPAFDL